MTTPRYFVMTGAATPADLLDRAGRHGAAGRAVAHATPHPSGCYGAVEIIETSKAEGRGDATQELAPSLTSVRDMPGWQEGDSSASPPNAHSERAP